MAVIALTGCRQHAKHFPSGTTYLGISVSTLTPKQALKKVKQALNDRSVVLKDHNGVTATLTTAEVFNPTLADLNQLLKTGEQPASTYKKLHTKLQALTTHELSAAIKPNAAQVMWQNGDYYIKKASPGTAVNVNHLQIAIVKNFAGTYLLSDYPQKVDYTSNAKAKKTLATLITKARNTKITVTIDQQSIEMPGDVIEPALLTHNQALTSVGAWVNHLNRQFAPTHNQVEFHPTTGNPITLQNFLPTGWHLKQNTATKKLITLLDGKTHHYDLPYSEAESIGKNYLEIDTARQLIYVYIKGQQKLTTTAVMQPNANAAGIYPIRLMQKNYALPTAGLDSKKILVPHWVAFSNQYLADLDSNFVKDNNTATIAVTEVSMKKIYPVIEPGFPVIVY